jgi:WD40 repeat protein
LLLWDIDTGQLIQRFVGQPDLIGHITFSEDGRTALTDGAASGSYLWDTASGTLLRHLDGGQVFSPDGQTIFGYAGSAMGQNSAVVIDLATGITTRRYTGFDGIAVQSRFTLDGHSVLVGFSNGKMEEWRIDTLDELIAWTRANRYIPQLTCDQRELYRLEPLCDEVPESGTTGSE